MGSGHTKLRQWTKDSTKGDKLGRTWTGKAVPKVRKLSGVYLALLVQNSVRSAT